jgi:hypothetical protein
VLLAALAAAAGACDSGNGPSADEPRLQRARFAAADPPPPGDDFAAQVSERPGAIDADVLLRVDVACNTIGAGIDAADTLLLVVQTTLRGGCEPLAGGTLLEAEIIGVPEDPPPFRIEWWHGGVVDTVWMDGPAEPSS